MHLYGQYCPVARAAEIFADRWTVLIIRELLADVNHFNELERGLPHISRTLLAERLRRLEQVGVLERRRPNGQAIGYFYYDNDPHSRPLNKRFASPHPERRPILLAAA